MNKFFFLAFSVSSVFFSWGFFFFDFLAEVLLPRRTGGRVVSSQSNNSFSLTIATGFRLTHLAYVRVTHESTAFNALACRDSWTALRTILRNIIVTPRCFNRKYLFLLLTIFTWKTTWFFTEDTAKRWTFYLYLKMKIFHIYYKSIQEYIFYLGSSKTI